MKLQAAFLIASATLLFGASTAQSAHRPWRKASFFLDGEKNSTLLAAVRTHTEKRIGFNGHFSAAYVSCGPSCGSYFFVDRRTGGVIVAPESSAEDEMTWDVAARPDSNIVRVTFGPRDVVNAKCSAQHYRWTDKKFVAVDKRRPTACPQ